MGNCVDVMQIMIILEITYDNLILELHKIQFISVLQALIARRTKGLNRFVFKILQAQLISKYLKLKSPQ
jgi:hypothetical protein